MKLPAPRTTRQDQLALWSDVHDTIITRYAEARPFSGDFFEARTSELVNGIRLRTDSTADICPDIREVNHPNRFHESKSVGSSGRALIYKCRWDNDERFVALGNRMTYWFWLHEAKVVLGQSKSEYERKLYDATTGVIILSHRALATVLSALPVKSINNLNRLARRPPTGFGGDVRYGNGWSIPVTLLKQAGEYSKAFAVPRPDYIPHHITAWHSSDIHL
jgi:hypothetical protein